MNWAWLGDTPRDRLRLAIVGAFLLACALGGGGSRVDTLSLLYVRPAAILAIAGLALTRPDWNFAAVRAPLILLGLLAAVVAVQLVPLPPAVWLALPGHALLGEAAAVAGIDQPWRPISLSPDLTFNSLLALLPALATLIGVAALGRRQRAVLLPVLIGMAAASALLGMAQLAVGRDGALRLYRVAHEDGAIGLFANRNHQAAFLAMALVWIGAWTALPADKVALGRQRRIVGLAAAILVMPMIVVTGSRAGLILGGIALVAGQAFAFWPMRKALTTRRRRGIAVAAIAAPFAAIALLLLLGRIVAVERLVGTDGLEADQRVQMAPVTWGIAKDYFPFGSGMGTFDAAFRIAEPDSALHRRFFNHAHNDLIETLLTGGLGASLVLAAFALWCAWRTWLLLSDRSVGTDVQRSGLVTGLAGGVTVLLMGVASLVDYPVRTPLMTVVLAIAAAWIAAGTARRAAN